MCHGKLARVAAPYQAFCDTAHCLSRATFSRRAPIWSSEEVHRVNTILNQPNRHCVTTDRLNRVDSQLVASFEGVSSRCPTLTPQHQVSEGGGTPDLILKIDFKRIRTRVVTVPNLLYCTVLYCTVVYCSVLYSDVNSSTKYWY